MKILKKLAGAAAAAAMIGFAAPASAIVVGGIDFGIIGASPFNTHLETTTLAETFVNGVGQAAQAYGAVASVNGDFTYCADGTANCSLYFVANTTVRSFVPLGGGLSYASFGGTTLNVYYSAAPIANLLTSGDSLANLAFIQSLSLWATLSGAPGVDLTDPGADQNATGLLTGATLSATGTGLLAVNLADGLGIAAVEAYLDANTIPAFGGNPNADMAFTSSANNLVLNPFDAAGPLADSCSTAGQQVGDWCYQGTLNLRGATVVPEPGSLALLGLGLIGLVVSRRKATRAL